MFVTKAIRGRALDAMRSSKVSRTLIGRFIHRVWKQNLKSFLLSFLRNLICAWTSKSDSRPLDLLKQAMRKQSIW